MTMCPLCRRTVRRKADQHGSWWKCQSSLCRHLRVARHMTRQQQHPFLLSVGSPTNPQHGVTMLGAVGLGGSEHTRSGTAAGHDNRPSTKSGTDKPALRKSENGAEARFEKVETRCWSEVTEDPSSFAFFDGTMGTGTERSNGSPMG